MIKTINVTPTDLKRGHRMFCTMCPVARAISRHLRTNYLASVSYENVSFIKVTREQHQGIPYDKEIGVGLYSIPTSVGTRIMEFDSRLPVEPFSFKLDIPKEALKRA